MSETEFLKITEAKQAQKGSFIGTIIKAGDLKSGTKDGRDWTKKVYTVQDDSADTELVCWGDEIKKFTVGHKYQFVNPWWKTYEGKVSVSLGKYCTVTDIGSANTEETTPTETTQEKITEGVKCPHGNPILVEYLCKKCVISTITGLITEIQIEPKKDD